MDRHGMSLLALDLASSDINLASPSADVVDFAVDAYARGIDRAAELGAYRDQLYGMAGRAQLAEENPAEARNLHDVAAGFGRTLAVEAIHQGTQQRAAIPGRRHPGRTMR